ncbi:hypothetical protein UNSWDHB_1454 [Dehalobacter sp. UNSWDHB]|nr:hypothetical protein DHBDCA_p460 [Dehalobacter sp. DCA]AFV04524.1 hypothetical protein DCF50_p518 [Dehalobacter sp. CF]EQB21195.1 hypothetical protein UNSWDHB_1454 [Dehalobacter sp. UNSWDHB]
MAESDRLVLKEICSPLYYNFRGYKVQIKMTNDGNNDRNIIMIEKINQDERG